MPFIFKVVFVVFSMISVALAGDHGHGDHGKKHHHNHSHADKSKAPNNSGFYGKAFESKKVFPILGAMESVKALDKKNIVVRGKVVKVCENSGCWFNLEAGDRSLRTSFEPYGIHVPKEIVGKTVHAFGVLEYKEVSVEEARHFKKDAGASQKEIDAIVKPQMDFQFKAKGVKILFSTPA